MKSTPIRIYLPKDLFEEIKGKAEVENVTTDKKLRDHIQRGLDWNVKGKIPKKYENIELNNCIAEDRRIVTVKTTFRVYEYYYNLLKEYAGRKGWTISRSARNIIINVTVNEKRNGRKEKT